VIVAVATSPPGSREALASGSHVSDSSRYLKKLRFPLSSADSVSGSFTSKFLPPSSGPNSSSYAKTLLIRS
jgi:hypothetical protein